MPQVPVPMAVRALKYAGENYIAKGKPVTRNMIAMEVSPTKEESKGWTFEQWNWFAHRFIEEMDKIEFKNKVLVSPSMQIRRKSILSLTVVLRMARSLKHFQPPFSWWFSYGQIK